MARSDTTTRSGKGGSSGGGGGPTGGGKKVTTACDNCRLKRQKCDGAHLVCGACAENQLACTYSRQTRRRGPPLGYLRHVEVRLHIADAFLGFVIACEPALLFTLQKYADTMAASNVVSSSKAGPEADSTIHKWDTWNAKWRESPVSRLLDSISAKFATPVSRPEVESPLRTGPSSAGTHPGLLLPSTSLISSNPTLSTRHRIDQEGHKGEMPYKPLHLSIQDDYSVSPDTLVSSGPLLPWSQEPAMTHLTDDAQSARLALNPLQLSSSNGLNIPVVPRNDMISFDLASLLDQSTWLPTSKESKGNQTLGSGRHKMSNTGDPDASGLDTVRYQGAATGMHHRASDASFWRLQASYTLDVAQPKDIDIHTTSAPQLSSSTPALATSIELPPIQVQHHLAEVYLQNVHPLFPLLSRTSILNRSSKSHNLILALCAYCACISPNLGMEDSAAFVSGVDDPTRITADMWYEQARSNVMNQSLRRPSDLETIQTVLFLVLRDQGRGLESQAWLLMGIVVRMSEDLGLHLNSSTWVGVPDHVKDTRRRVWGVVCIVDLLISLPLGRPPSILDPQWASEIPISPPPPPDVGLPGSLETYSTPTPHYFAYTASLCLIISRINFQLYLCGNTTEAEKLEKLDSLKAELDAWHARLPAALRISIDYPAPLPVLDVNLLYHAALILLYRPFRSNANIPAIRISLDAASAFNRPELTSRGFTLCETLNCRLRHTCQPRCWPPSPTSSAVLKHLRTLVPPGPLLSGATAPWRE
ncbi:hypothetical protein BS47DRAFT_509147 [Hydnum rufescens UP504]|uniref:Zn(2)-C6 fungal-type domain-containing protein n=1 Tax=Hydnum rufescens UP504 TaxID=1448309 RepID=A0A9P6B4M0_9AGAM|nr:hypothetical protein BS47DRAFT_509147 [Hydnum rufescens UP504]